VGAVDDPSSPSSTCTPLTPSRVNRVHSQPTGAAPSVMDESGGRHDNGRVSKDDEREYLSVGTGDSRIPGALRKRQCGWS
jgi:hypothetical protein